MTIVNTVDEFNNLENNQDQRIALFKTQPLVRHCVGGYVGNGDIGYRNRLHYLEYKTKIWCLDGRVQQLERSVVFSLEKNARNFNGKQEYAEIFDKENSIYEYLLAVAYIKDASTILQYSDEIIRLETDMRTPQQGSYKSITFFDLFLICKRKLEAYESKKSSI